MQPRTSPNESVHSYGDWLCKNHYTHFSCTRNSFSTLTNSPVSIIMWYFTAKSILTTGQLLKKPKINSKQLLFFDLNISIFPSTNHNELNKNFEFSPLRAPANSKQFICMKFQLLSFTISILGRQLNINYKILWNKSILYEYLINFMSSETGQHSWMKKNPPSPRIDIFYGGKKYLLRVLRKIVARWICKYDNL